MVWVGPVALWVFQHLIPSSECPGSGAGCAIISPLSWWAYPLPGRQHHQEADVSQGSIFKPAIPPWNWTKLRSTPPKHSEANLAPVVVKESTAVTAGQARRSCNSSAKDPNSPAAVREGCLKTAWGRGSLGYVIRWYLILWLVDGKETGWCFWHLNHQPSISNRSGFYMFVVSMELAFST